MFESEFVKYAKQFFDVLKWKPAPPDTLGEPYIVVYGNMNEQGLGTYCAIDPKAQIFKIQLNAHSEDQKLFTKIVVRYSNDFEGCRLFDHWMDCLGGFVKEGLSQV